MRSYEWTNWKSILNVISYRSASTLTGSLTIDTTAPVLTARGTTSGKTLSNAAITNEHVTVTVTDANHARLYYKTPSNGNFLSTTEKSFTSGATNGKYTVYAVDGLGQKAKSSLFITTTLRRQASCMTEARSQEKTVHIYPHKP